MKNCINMNSHGVLKLASAFFSGACSAFVEGDKQYARILKLKLVLQLVEFIRRSTNFSLSYLIYMFVVNPPSPRNYGATSVARHVLKVGTCFSMYHLNSILIKELDRLPSTGSGQESPSLLLETSLTGFTTNEIQTHVFEV